MSDYAGGGPAPYGGSASAPIGAPTPEPGEDWQAVVDADEEAEHDEQARNATDNPELAENVKENREADAEAEEHADTPDHDD